MVTREILDADWAAPASRDPGGDDCADSFPKRNRRFRHDSSRRAFTVPECGDDMFIKCPARAYDPSDYLGIGGSRLVVAEVAAGRYTPSDVPGQIDANRHDAVKICSS